MKHTKKKRILAIVLCMILVLSTGIAAFANENVSLQSVACQATTLERVMKNADGEEVGTLIADIPEGAFLASSSDANIQMDVQADTGEEGVLNRVQQELEKNSETGYTLNNYVMSDVTFYVNGEKQVPQKAITFTVKGTGLDSQKVVAFSDDRQNNPTILDTTEVTTEDGDNALQFTAETTSETVVYGLAEKEETQAENQDNVKDTEPEVIAYEQNYSDDQIDINVTAGEGVVPENAELKVTPIVKTDITDTMSEEDKAKATEINQQYDLTEKKLNESSEEDGTKLSGFLAYDISFLVNGEEVEPNGDVSVKMNFKEAVKPEGVTDNSFVEVKHLKEDTTADDGVKVENLNENTNVETTDAVEVQKVELTADSFSTFAITWGNMEAQVTVKYVDEDGNELNSDKFNANTFALEYINRQLTFTDNTQFPADTYTPSPVIINRKQYEYQCVKIDGMEVNAVRTNNINHSPFIYEYLDTSGKWHTWTSEKTVSIVYKYELTTVETVDSTSDGIIMRMIDYGGDTNGKLTNGSNSINIGGAYESGNIKQGLLNNKLGSDGYPVATANNIRNKSLAFLFSENATDAQNVNHLFRKDIYENTGYYEYSSFNNYAYLNSDGNFTVYDQIGTPEDSSAYFYRRGNFMPYNKIAAGKYSSYTNGYDEDGTELAESNPAYNRTLYKTQGTNNYLFGMYMEANFIQPTDGINTKTKQSMCYEFNGDDDMWIYIDGVLVLDIGGIHDAHSGKIDFKTGLVSWKDCEKGGTPVEYFTSIIDCYRNAGVFPDGSTWDESKINDYFVKTDSKVPKTGGKEYTNRDSYTFKNYTSHTMKMFYMERGAGASNLHMKFNLEVMPKGAIQVEKQLTNTDKQKYSSMDFGFQVYAQKIANKDTTSGKETYSDEYELLDADTIAREGITATYSKGSKKGQSVSIGEQTFENKTYQGVFLLKSDEAVNFTGLQADRKYYIKEVGVSANEYDKVWINEKLYENKDSGIFEIEGDKASVESRPYVVCYNNCSAANSRELKITKKMANGQATQDTFTFKIQLSDQSGKLVPYANGDYYLVTTSGDTRTYYYYDQNNNLQSSQNAVVCGKTDENGLVTGVPENYTVVVTQILSGTNFLVTEVNLNENYQKPDINVVDGTYDTATLEGAYEGAYGAIKLGTDAEVIITNTLKERLQVEKKWAGADAADAADVSDTTVYVGLYQINKDKSTTPVDGKYVALNKDNNWKGRFEGLDGSYTVKELRKTTDGETPEFTINEEGYIGLDAGDTIEVSGTTYRVSYGSKSTDATGLSKIDITNATVWQIKKISANSTTDKKLYLKGAEFTFTDAKKNVIYARSDDNGLVHFYSDNGYTTEVHYLPDGVYAVKETKAPAGYSVSTTNWTLTVENGLVKETNLTKATQNDNETMETYYLKNTPLYKLPHTGGPGIYLFTIGGILLMGAAAWILYKNKRREVLKR